MTSPLIEVDEARGLFRVARNSLIDPDIFAKEKRAVFDTSWLYVGHESELTEPGQYVVRNAGGREIILNRDSAGQVRAFLNACPHRGARLCTDTAGNLRSFRCYYHGWSFATDGKLRSLPDRNTSYPADFNDDGALDMTPVPRLEHYRGLYFVCFDATTMSLNDYLGNARTFIDDAMDQGPDGMEVVEGTQEYAVQANWKLATENGVDGNHATTLHATYFQYVATLTPPEAAPTINRDNDSRTPVPGVTYELGNGHVAVEYAVPWGRVAGQWTPILGADVKDEVEEVFRRNCERLGRERAERIAAKSRNLLIFPNLHIVDSTGLTLRVSHPEAVDTTHVTSQALAARGESDRLRQLRIRSFLEFLGPGGFATPDDIEAMEQCQRAYQTTAHLAPWNDLSKGSLTGDNGRLEEEGNLRIFWSEWARRLGDPTAIRRAEHHRPVTSKPLSIGANS